MNHLDVADVWEVAFSPDGQYAISTYGGTGRFVTEGRIVLWDVATGEEIRRFDTNGPVRSLAFSPDGRYVLTAETNAVSSLTPSAIGVRLWDLETSSQIWWKQGHTDLIWLDAISPDRLYGASSSYDNSVRLWDLATGQEVCSFEGHIGYVAGLTFTPDGTQVISAGEDRSLILWDVETCKRVRHFEEHSLEVYDVAVSPNGRHVVSVGADRLVILWDLQTGEKLRSFKGHRQRGVVVAFSPDGQYVVRGEEGGDAILWHIVDTPEEIINWGRNNRFIRELTCAEREFYDVQPSCGPNGVLPSKTPFPSLQLSSTPEPTPTINLRYVAPSLNSLGVYFEIYGPDGGLLFDRTTLDVNAPYIGPLTLLDSGDYLFVIGSDPATNGGRYTVTLNFAQDN